jgi:hypothetical protein
MDGEIKVNSEDESYAGREPLKLLIFFAFDGISREGGVSWADARYLDNGDRADPFHDKDKSWQELVADPQWDLSDGNGGFGFLDPIGFRYYLPAAMIRALNEESDWIENYLSLVPHASNELRLHQWSLLSPEQRRCVGAYLRFQHREEFAMWGEDFGEMWSEEWNYWAPSRD